MNNKKFAAAAICASLVLVLSIGGALAYLGSKDNKENKVVIGHGDETISEVFSSPEVQSAPSDSIQKTVNVVNNGDTPCYARLYVDFSDSDIRDKAVIRMAENGTYYTWAEFKGALKPVDPSAAVLSPKTDSPNPDWIYIEDDTALGGYFYYTKELTTDNSGKTTTPLFNYVETKYDQGETYYTESNKEDFIADYNIVVYSETVQTIDHGNKITDWKEAWQKFLRVTP